MSSSRFELRTLSLEQLAFLPGNPRLDIYDDDLKALSESLLRDGLIEPIVARPKGDKYEVIAGERRVRAAILANITRLPAIIREGMTDQEASRLRLLENMKRKDLTLVERVKGIRAYMEAYGITLDDAATELGLKPATVKGWSNTVDELSPQLKGDIAFIRKLSPDVLSLLGKYDFDTQEKLAQIIVMHGLTDWTARYFTDMFEADPDADLHQLAEQARKGVKTIAVTLPVEEAKKVQQRAKEIRREEFKASEKIKKHLRKEKSRPRQEVIKVETPPSSESPKTTTTEVPLETPSIVRERETEVARASTTLNFTPQQTGRLMQLAKQQPNISVKDLSKEVTEESPPTQIMVIETPGRLYKSLTTYANKQGMFPKAAALSLIEEGLERHGFWKKGEEVNDRL